MSSDWIVVTLPLTPAHWAKLGFRRSGFTEAEFDRLLELLGEMRVGLVHRPKRIVGAGAFPRERTAAA